MSYAPQNPDMFTRVYSGALAGMCVSHRQITSTNPATYAGYCSVAGAFAREFDMVWALTPTSELELQIGEEASEAIWEDRAASIDPTTMTPATYAGMVGAVIALMQAALAYYTASGIVPPPPGGGGVTAVLATFPVLSSGGTTPTISLSPGALVPSTRAVTAGAGMTGGGALSANITLDVVANADGSIVVHPNDVQVGVLATDAQHGVRGGGTQHALVIPAGAAGFMSGADKAKLDAIPPGGGGAAVISWGSGKISKTVTPRYLDPWFTGNHLAQTTLLQYRVPRAGNLQHMRVRQNNPAGNGNAIVYTVYVNGVASALTSTMASTATDSSNLVNVVSVVAGDLLALKVTKAVQVGSGPVNVIATLELAA